MSQFCNGVSAKPKCQNIQETNNVVRLTKAHTDVTLPVCKILVNQICLDYYADANDGSVHAEQAQTGFVIMFADMSLLARLAPPVPPVSLRSQCETICCQRLKSGNQVCLRRLHKVTGYVRSGVK